jgi:hypothetical protein
MTRWKASAIHLSLSLLLALAVGALLFFVWYPGALFEASGGDRLVVLLITIDVVIGPLLTLIVYKHGKRGMAFDLAFIGFCQVAALLYGLHVIKDARPVFLVVAVDRIIAVPANGLAQEDLNQAPPAFRRMSWTGPVPVFARMPDDADTRDNLLFSAMRGKDLDRFPQYYAPYAEHRADILARAHELSALRGKGSDADAALDRFAARHHGRLDDYVYLPLVARSRDLVAVLQRQDARIIDYLRIDPWR